MIAAPRARARIGAALVLAGAALLLLAGALGCAGARDAAERPSFVVLLSDDQRFDALGVVQREQGAHARAPWLATPNLDRLAAEGVRFRNAFVVSSLCSPSRASFLTGLYGHANGIVDNRTPLGAGTDTIASRLRAQGYRTGFVGKWHMGGQVERPGFDWAASYVGQGSYFDCTFLVDGTPQPTRGWVDDVATDFAVEFLRRQGSRPFLLVVGYKSPHGPHGDASLPERARGRYRAAPLEPPRNADALPPYPAPRPRGGVGDAERRRYFELVSALDDAIGRLLAEIDARGLAERTVVVFAGDNGYLLGEHGMRTKRSAYEGSIRIPLLVRGPGRATAGRVVDTAVLNVDLAPTLFELAGVAAPRTLHGRSLRALARPGAAPSRRAFLYEYFAEPGYGMPTQLALRAPDAKLVVFPGHPEWTQLFDLGADPGERRNLVGEPQRAAQLAQLRAELAREARALGLDPALTATAGN